MKKESKVFQTETKELLNLMIHSIYTNKEIFLRELISNSSDAIDKVKFKSLTDESITKDDKDFKIEISFDKEKRTITISDNGIGMSYDEVSENIGTIAKSGSKIFKQSMDKEKSDDVDLIGQFGVGFYSGFIVADKISLISKSPFEKNAVKWESDGEGEYTIEEVKGEKRGTTITLHMKKGEDYDEFLEEWKIKELVKKYSDYIKYPIYFKEEIINSTKPIWQIDKKKLKEEDYNEFYKTNFHNWDSPLTHFHIKVQGNLDYSAIIYVPKKAPMDFYSKNFKKGLQLYSKNIFIMEKCEDLIPEYFGFLTGLVDSDSLSLNISREILQQNKELQDISKHLEKKIISELEKMIKNKRELYLELWKEFGRSIKFGIQDMFGINKDKLKNLLMFISSNEDKFITLKEYVDNMGENKEILYVSGEDANKIKSLPKMKLLKDKGRDVLILTDKIDEFTLQALSEYEGKEFKSINDSDFKLDESKENEEEIKKITEENKNVLEKIKTALSDKVESVELSNELNDSASALLTKGQISLEMEKVLSEIPGNEGIKATKILAINPNHKIFTKLQNEKDELKVEKLSRILYDQALLIEGFSIEDPAEFINNINSLIS